MAKSILLLTAAAAAFVVRLAVAQQAGWATGQVNTTMCYWQNPRAGVIRDKLYIDGGYLWWNPGFADGTYGTPAADGNPLGIVYQLNFSTPFNTSQNISAILTTISKASGGSGNANNIGPQYMDGTMMANDFEWFTYGGLLADTNAYQNPDAQSVAVYQEYPTLPSKQFQPGYLVEDLPAGMNRYVTYGAGVSVPSENLGFYFGGLRSQSWGEIVLGTSNETLNADTNSLTLMGLDMTVQGKEVWSNSTLPPTVPGRASAEIVWIPVSEQGILVAIGGVIDPVYATVNQSINATLIFASNQTSPKFMETVSVYDIATKAWYEQPTSGQIPGQLAEGCTVVASAQDGSSHNIYWYGGFDGLSLDGDDNYSDDVWILSVPSFVWKKFTTGNPTHARAGHRCVKPYPDQMFVVGGGATLPSSGSPLCLDGGIVQVFNLSSGAWLDSYDPKKWSNYTVPDTIVSAIGGNGGGSATLLAPASTGFANSSLSAVFKQAYSTSKITTWYPYSATAAPTTTPSPSPSVIAKPSGTPSYLAPVLAVVLGLFFITLLILAFLLYRHRKALRLNNGTNPSENGTMDSRFWVANWLRATPADAKAPTVTTDETPMTPYEDVRPWVQEVGGTQVHELMDTSPPAELQANNTGLVPIPATRNGNLAASASVTSNTSQATSIVSRGSHNSYPSPTRPGISPAQRSPANSAPNSPPLGRAAEARRFTSGVSNISDTDRGHLRGISETSVSTEGNFVTPLEGRDGDRDPLGEISETAERAVDKPPAVSPLTPYWPNDPNDYLGAGAAGAKGGHVAAAVAAGGGAAAGSPSRRSNFAEGLDEMRK